MSRIILTTYGSLGDLNPFIATAVGLRDRGHEVTFAVERANLEPVRRQGFEVRELSGNSEGALEGYHKELFGGREPMAAMRILVEHDVVPTLRNKVRELSEACEGADLLVSSSLQPAASIVAEMTRIHWASVSISPIGIPSRHLEGFSLPVPMPQRIQPFVNGTLATLGKVAIRRIADRPINQIRGEFGLPRSKDVLSVEGLSRELIAVPASPAFVPHPPDWPSQARMTGFCYWEDPSATWADQERVQQFLERLGPVVAVSSGSMASWVKTEFTAFFRASVEAVRMSGGRPLVVGAADGVFKQDHGEDMLCVPYVPFSQVYPQCAAVINHGGMGTVAEGLRAGVPQLVVPWGVDQFFTGARVQRIGVGKWMRRQSYEPQRVANALGDLIQEPSYRERAKGLREQIAREQGVRNMCDALEEVLAPARSRATA